MEGYGAYSDDFYLNMTLGTEMDLPENRETVLHHFEQFKRRFPTLQNFYSRESNEYVLEEEKEHGTYRWTSIESRRVNSGAVNPPSFEAATELHRTLLEMVPYTLSVSPLDCESLSVTMGFDFTFRGDQNEVMHEALGILPGFDKLLEMPNSRLLCHEPTIQLALDDDCRTQCRVSFETRTTAYHVRTRDFPEDQLSAYLTVRRYDSLSSDEDYVTEFDRLATLCRELVDGYMVANVLRPLQQAIALK
ncbi:hypothetical protein FF011L_45450 [Roseimaritima multifibrata]|uniref:TIGR04255 family protein n=1 Tax=Roseimaritima multifibrata TaxID=1930274 RepID=A0A517MLG7_9BACT|nr:hypothetical protein [Roseimaritima multifibrata]QDS95745.1 hypothetical protein FF011L_45450 [Roseimaritima multifibrata]